MIQIVNGNFSQGQWNEIVSPFNDLSLMQTWEYAEAKTVDRSWKVQRSIFTDEGRVVGAVQAMVRLLPFGRKGLVWISRGPLWRHEDNTPAAVGLEVLHALRRHWVGERGIYLRLLPTFLEGEVAAEAFNDAGYVLPERSVRWESARLDLSQSNEILRSRLQRKWRGHLNQAERSGIVVDSGIGETLFQEVLAEYQALLESKAFSSVVTPKLLVDLQSRLPDERRLWSLVARQGDQRLGGVLIARYGGTCEYLVGAVNDAGKTIGAGQLLLWRAICQMKESGLNWFDVGGTDSVGTTKGVLYFKNGMSGLPYALNREIEAFNTRLLTKAIRWRVSRERQPA